MKKSFYIIAILLVSVFTFDANSQYKAQRPDQTSVVKSLYRPAPSISGMLSWFNAENFRMNHNFSMQYISGGGSGLSLASYTNSMFYQISNSIDTRLDVSLIGSPFGQYSKQDNFNRLLISRAELNFRPSDNFQIQLQYRQLPISYYGYYMPHHWYTSPFNFED